MIIRVMNTKLRSVHKYIFFNGMSMKIYEKIQRLLELCFQIFDEFKQMITLWKGELSGLLKRSVKVFSEKAGSIVTSDDPIRVNHRYNKSDKIFAELFCSRLVAANELKKTFTYERAVGLSWMNAACYDDYFFVVIFRVLIGDLEHWNRKATETFKWRKSIIVFEGREKIEKPRVGIRNKIGELDKVIWSLEVVREAQSNVVF